MVIKVKNIYIFHLKAGEKEKFMVNCLGPNPREQESRARRVISLSWRPENCGFASEVWEQKSSCHELCSSTSMKPELRSPRQENRDPSARRGNKDAFCISCSILPSINSVIPAFVGEGSLFTVPIPVLVHYETLYRNFQEKMTRYALG